MKKAFIVAMMSCVTAFLGTCVWMGWRAAQEAAINVLILLGALIIWLLCAAIAYMGWEG